jgi:hypothetical protein
VIVDLILNFPQPGYRFRDAVNDVESFQAYCADCIVPIGVANEVFRIRTANWLFV